MDRAGTGRDERSLAGRRVVVTRAAVQSGALREALVARGAAAAASASPKPLPPRCSRILPASTSMSTGFSRMNWGMPR